MLWYKILGRTDGNIATKKGVLTIEKRPLFWENGRAVLAGNCTLDREKKLYGQTGADRDWKVKKEIKIIFLGLLAARV